MPTKKTYHCNSCNAPIEPTETYIQKEQKATVSLTRYQGSIKLDHIHQQSKKLITRYCMPCAIMRFPEFEDKILY